MVAYQGDLVAFESKLDGRPDFYHLIKADSEFLFFA
jgi:hypothetical protein